VRDEINNVTDLHETSETHHLPGGIQAWLDGLLDQAVPPVGHGRALTLPDMPFLQWQYKNGRNEVIKRDNTAIFLDAADVLCKVMQTCRTGTSSPGGLNTADRSRIHELFATITSTECDVRHKAWLAAIQSGQFSFGPAAIAYAPGTWQAEALGTTENLAEYYFDQGFLTTRWKHFQDALQRHKLTVLHDILPRYGICTG
jgi:hypothetical protein